MKRHSIGLLRTVCTLEFIYFQDTTVDTDHCWNIATDPSCPSGILQFQHGSYSVSADGSMVLHPIASDGRQLLSEPCHSSTASYTRYNNTELFKVSTTQV